MFCLPSTSLDDVTALRRENLGALAPTRVRLFWICRSRFVWECERFWCRALQQSSSTEQRG